MSPVDYIAYFKSLVEGDPSAQHWNDWWESHGTEMSTLVPRGMYLRLTSPGSDTKYMAVFAILDMAGFSYPRPEHYLHIKFWEPNPIPDAWLQKRTTFSEVEAFFRMPTHWYSHLAIIREIFKPNDEVWTFCSPDTTWTAMMGRQGFAFLRDGKCYEHICTLLN